ncbi:MAG: hypothetical protein HY820_23695 [Acidobacteria bacterium]|nr:hypothetical protein [Acidobacteriota bacterium]
MSAYRDAVDDALDDWEKPPTLGPVTFPSMRTKSPASIAGVALIRKIMAADPVYDDRLVDAVDHLLGKPHTGVYAEAPLAVGSRLRTCLVSRLATNPAADMEPRVKHEDFSLFRAWYTAKAAADKVLFSCHGGVLPKVVRQAGHPEQTRLLHTYYFYCQPGASLSYTEYQKALPDLGNRYVDSFGPSSGSVPNMVLQCLDANLFHLTASYFSTYAKSLNGTGAALVTINKPGQVMTLDVVDKQLIPYLATKGWNTKDGIHMIVCRGNML